MLTSGQQLYTDISLVHPPLFIYSIAAFALTETSVAVGRIVAIAYATVGLLAVALTIEELRGGISSIIAMITLSIAPRFYHYSGTVLLDLPYISLATLSIVFSLYYRRLGKPRWLMLTGLTLVASYLTKLLLLPTFFPIVLALFLHARSRTLQTQWYSKLLVHLSKPARCSA
jgi:4-amino-4-deoxy-L-arabinose transferase-like glycosyltransferase